MTCTTTRRERLREARRALLAFPDVFGASLHSPTEGCHDRWTVELALGPEADGVGPELAAVQHQHDLTLLAAGPRSPLSHRVVFGLASRA